MNCFASVSRLYDTINEQHLLKKGFPLMITLDSLKTHVQSVCLCDVASANHSYKSWSQRLREIANINGLVEPSVLDAPVTRLELVDPECLTVTPRTELEFVVEHLKIYQRDVEICSRMEGDAFSIQRHIRHPEYHTLRNRLFGFLMPNGVWSEKRAMQLCVNGFNIVKPWCANDKLELTIGKYSVSICKVVPEYCFDPKVLLKESL